MRELVGSHKRSNSSKEDQGGPRRRVDFYDALEGEEDLLAKIARRALQQEERHGQGGWVVTTQCVSPAAWPEGSIRQWTVVKAQRDLEATPEGTQAVFFTWSSAPQMSLSLRLSRSLELLLHTLPFVTNHLVSMGGSYLLPPASFGQCLSEKPKNDRTQRILPELGRREQAWGI